MTDQTPGPALRWALLTAPAYIACVVLANVLTEHYGLVPVGFGLTVTAGTFAAGATLLARNVTQDASGMVPWSEFDVLFIGGDDAWKLGPHAWSLAAEARLRGKRVHMGRVNSLRRLAFASLTDCDSADGTYVRYGPDKNITKVEAWLDDVNHANLFGGAA